MFLMVTLSYFLQALKRHPEITAKKSKPWLGIVHELAKYRNESLLLKSKTSSLFGRNRTCGSATRLISAGYSCHHCTCSKNTKGCRT
jgi:hypothetical protein